LRNCVILGCLAAILVAAQEKSTVPQVQQSSMNVVAATPGSDRVLPVNYAPADVQVLGNLDYGQTSDSVKCSTNPHYRAFVFSAYGGESVDVTVKSADRKAFVSIADSSLALVASGATHLSVRLPYRGPDIEVWYIVFRDFDNRPARFTVQLKKIENMSGKARSEAPPGY
jgi:hypothetical protein